MIIRDAQIAIPASGIDTNTEVEYSTPIPVEYACMFVFVMQLNLSQSPCSRKNMMRNAVQITEKVILLCVMALLSTY